MKQRVVVLAFAVSLTVMRVALLAQHEGHEAGATAPAASATECVQGQQVADAAIEAALKRVEEARQTNSPAQLRAAADDLQNVLLDIRARIAPCATMQNVATADAHAGHQMPATAGASPASTADPHAGHVMPGAAATPQTPAQTGDVHAGHQMPQSAAPAAANPYAGHQMPPAATTSTGGAAAGAHAGHVMPAPKAATGAPATSAAAPSAAAARAGTSPSPATYFSELKCREQLNARTAPRMLYQGRMYYFCSETERAEFAKDPGRYAIAPAAGASEHEHAH